MLGMDYLQVSVHNLWDSIKPVRFCLIEKCALFLVLIVALRYVIPGWQGEK